VTPAMRATAVYLGLVLKMNFEGVGVQHWPAEASEEAASSAAGAAGPSSSAPAQVGAPVSLSPPSLCNTCMHLEFNRILATLSYSLIAEVAGMLGNMCGKVQTACTKAAQGG
jgi:hypothetical protein